MQFRHWILQEGLEDYVPQLFAFLKQQPDDVVVHFSQWFRVGYNIKPSHQDPMGVYTFPKKYILSADFAKKNSHFFSMGNAFVLRPNSSRVLNLSKISMQDVEAIAAKMGIPATDGAGHHSLMRGAVAKPGHALWDSMEKFLATKNYAGKTKNFQWTKMILNAGFDVLMDDGDSIIHSNEPYQVVFLRPGTYQELTHFQHQTTSIYNKLALRAVNYLTSQLFDGGKARIRVSKKPSEVTIYADGKYKGHPLQAWATYYPNDDKKMNRELRIAFYVNSDLGTEHTYFHIGDDRNRVEVSFSPDEPSMEHKVDKVVAMFKSIMDKEDYFRGSKKEEVKKVAESVIKLLGIKTELKQSKEESFDFVKRMKGYGTLIGFVSYHKWQSYRAEEHPDGYFHLGLSLKPEKTNSYYQHPTLHGGGDPEVSHHYIEVGPDYVANSLLRKIIKYWRQSVETNYPTDDEKYHLSDYSKYDKMKTGQFFTKFIDEIRDRISKAL